ncbi:hypothetical protein [Helicobacter macacae]|uniref:hypothetical protein n=1 Tax=Helicobacter macacae TaxID=398626 RepID=UPI0011DDE296|nr:hypothetical protein [Helicobacter macacae]
MTRNKKPPPSAEGVWGWVSYLSLRGIGLNTTKQSTTPSLRENERSEFSWQSIKIKKNINAEKGNNT